MVLLPCSGVKEGYFKTPDFLNWLRTGLLPALRFDGRPTRVIVMNNNSIHIDEAVVDAIEAEGHLVRFLPPYSPRFQPDRAFFLGIECVAPAQLHLDPPPI
jgi:transposase